MTFLAIIAALALEQALRAADLEGLRRAAWFESYRDMLLPGLMRLPISSGSLAVAVLCLLPTALIWVLIWLAAGWSLVLGFAFSVLVLLYCLGPRDLLGQLKAYVEAHSEGSQASPREIVAGILEEGQALSAEDDAHRAVTEAALVRANDRLFAVIFWFAVLGPAGAVFYRAADLLRRGLARGSEDATSDLAQAAVRLEGLLAWLPARLLAAGYALTGSFEEAISDWKAYYEECDEPFFETSEGVLSCTGCGALRISAGTSEAGLAIVRSARNLLRRTLVLWLTVLAVLTLAGLA
jgi:AmpE protein